jgi:F0F1-type ATP synthase assembly protein I
MADDQPPRRSPQQPAGAELGWSALSYLLAGIGGWGFIGWLVDKWLDVPKHFGLMVGMIIGGAAAVYLIVKKLGA